MNAWPSTNESPGLPLASPWLPFTAAPFAGPSDSGIQRGDREETGDNEARPDELGSGGAQKTGDRTALGGTSPIGDHSHSPDAFDMGAELDEYDGLDITTADDGRLGLTNTGKVPPDDWPADTGETRTPEGS